MDVAFFENFADPVPPCEQAGVIYDERGFWLCPGCAATLETLEAATWAEDNEDDVWKGTPHESR